MTLDPNMSVEPIAVSNVLKMMSSHWVNDSAVGIRIATLFEDTACSYYATEIAPGKSVTPHYHCRGNEIYIIFASMGAS